MKQFVIALLISMFIGGSAAYAHEQTPAYPQLRQSYYEGVWLTTIVVFNRRTDVRFYDIDVFDADWKPVAFATHNRTVTIEYLDKKTIDIYIRQTDKNKVVYICSRSRLLKDDVKTTAVSSKICSKVKR